MDKYLQFVELIDDALKKDDSKRNKLREWKHWQSLRDYVVPTWSGKYGSRRFFDEQPEDFMKPASNFKGPRISHTLIAEFFRQNFNYDDLEQELPWVKKIS